MLAGIFASHLIEGEAPDAPPRASALGSLVNYITQADPKKFQPANITFDLLQPLEKQIRDRQQRHKIQCDVALAAFDNWLKKASLRTQSGEASRAS
jgi:methylenetetrahydrofolate--tRNA-(uracil-5-)-methyltransferase